MKEEKIAEEPACPIDSMKPTKSPRKPAEQLQYQPQAAYSSQAPPDKDQWSPEGSNGAEAEEGPDGIDCGRKPRRHSMKLPDTRTSASIFDDLDSETGSLESLLFPMAVYSGSSGGGGQLLSPGDYRRDYSMSPFSRIRSDIEMFVDASDRDIEARFLAAAAAAGFPSRSQTSSVGPASPKAWPQGNFLLNLKRSTLNSPLIGPALTVSPEARAQHVVCLSGFPVGTAIDEDEVKEAFGKFGVIALIQSDEATGTASVSFDAQNSATQAAREMSGKPFGTLSTPLQVSLANSTDRNAKIVTLLTQELDFLSTTTSLTSTGLLDSRTLLVEGQREGSSLHLAQVTNAFSQCGQLEGVRSSKSGGVLVSFAAAVDAESAAKTMDGTNVGGETIRISFARCLPTNPDLVARRRTGRRASISLSIGGSSGGGSSFGLPNPATLSTFLPGDPPAELDHSSLQTIFAPTTEDRLQHFEQTARRRKSLTASALTVALAENNSAMKKVASSSSSSSTGQPAPPTDPIPYSDGLIDGMGVLPMGGASGLFEHGGSAEDFCHPFPELPPPYFGMELTPARIREYRRHVESPNCKPNEFDLIAMELIPVLVSASTDPIGNVLVQKLVERGSDDLKSMIITQLAPYLATIGVHKNGTWVVQKLINWCHSPIHQASVVQCLCPYTITLMHDQYGNYVIQCCLQFGEERNGFILEALHAQCLAICTSRFGSRALRSCLESPYISLAQQNEAAATIIKYADVLLADQNGVIVMQWLIDSDYPGRFAALLPVAAPSLAKIVGQRFANNILSKLLTQQAEPDARNGMLAALLADPEDPQGPLQVFLREPGCVPIGLRVISSLQSAAQRQVFLDALKKAQRFLPLAQFPHLQRLLNEAVSVSGSAVPKSNLMARRQSLGELDLQFPNQVPAPYSEPSPGPTVSIIPKITPHVPNLQHHLTFGTASSAHSQTNGPQPSFKATNGNPDTAERPNEIR